MTGEQSAPARRQARSQNSGAHLTIAAGHQQGMTEFPYGQSSSWA